MLLTPMAVTKANIEQTVIKDKFLTTSRRSAPATYASMCKKYGIK